MKNLYLVRHAKSSWNHSDLTDFDRPLNDRGASDAPRMALRLKEQGITPDLMLSSPAVRALETCKAFCKILNYPEDSIMQIQYLYHADPDTLLQVVREIKDNHRSVMIICHNPGITEFANKLMDIAIDNIPTTGIVACQLNVDRWKDVKAGIGKLEFFDFPKKDISE